MFRMEVTDLTISYKRFEQRCKLLLLGTQRAKEKALRLFSGRQVVVVL